MRSNESSSNSSALNSSKLDSSTLDSSTLDSSTLDSSTLDSSTLDSSTLDSSTLNNELYEPEQQCAICLVDHPVSEMYTVNCATSHRFCFECFKHHVAAAVNEGKVLSKRVRRAQESE
jgi:hypothetical protein